MRVLVVGGAGYIGGAVVDILRERNIPFTVYDNLLYEDRYLKPVEIIYGDVRDIKHLKSLLPEYTHVIWLAAIVGDAACEVKPDLTTSINRDAVKWLADNYNGRIVFTSTCSVYGQNNEELNEEFPLNPLSLYAKTKLEAEKLLADKDVIIFRLGTVYGIGDLYSRIRMDLVVNYMTARAHTYGKLQVHGGEQWRPLIHVRNVGEAIVNSLGRPHTGIYNLKTSNYKIRDLGQEIASIIGCDLEIVEQKFEDNRNYRVSSDKAEGAGLLDFAEVFDVAHGVSEIHKLVTSKRVRYTDNDVYFNERHIANLANDGKI